MGTARIQGSKIQGLDAALSGLQIVGEAGYFSLESLKGEPISLPAGSYKIYACSLKLDPTSKTPLDISCAPDSNLVVDAGKETTLTITGSLKMAISPDAKVLTMRPGNTETINWDIKIGDKITVSSMGDRSEAGAPKVSFFDKTGKLVYTTKAGST